VLPAWRKASEIHGRTDDPLSVSQRNSGGSRVVRSSLDSPSARRIGHVHGRMLSPWITRQIQANLSHRIAGACCMRRQDDESDVHWLS
jgi:hypothetical protein